MQHGRSLLYELGRHMHLCQVLAQVSLSLTIAIAPWKVRSEDAP
jgi:hypothetical protein